MAEVYTWVEWKGKPLLELVEQDKQRKIDEITKDEIIYNLEGYLTIWNGRQEEPTGITKEEIIWRFDANSSSRRILLNKLWITKQVNTTTKKINKVLREVWSYFSNDANLQQRLHSERRKVNERLRNNWKSIQI